MAAIDEIVIVMRGRNAAANRHRSWRGDARRDLFGEWTVRVSFGRIGCAGRAIARAFASKEDGRHAYIGACR
jgi:predicted DNA-binding WGR domain protein